MATAFTSLLGLALPVTGELSGAWGDTVNTAITSLLDSAVSGTTTLSADADVTLTTSDGIANEARQAILLWTATGSVTRNITAPARSKAYFVVNKTGGTQSIVIRGAGPTTGVTVRAGQQSLVVFDGTDFVEVASGDVDGPSSATDNAVARFDGTTGKLIQNSVVTIADSTGNMAGVGTLGVGAITTSGALTYGGVTLSNAVTGTGNMVLSTSPTLTTPALGTPSALVGTNITGTASGLTAGNVTTNANLTGAITSTGNATVLGSFTSAALAAAVTDETGTGALVFANSPTLVTPALGTPASGVVTNLTGTASININGTVGATTASTGAFTNLAYTGTLTGGTGVVNLGSGQFFKGTNGNVGIGTSSPGSKLTISGGNISLASNATFLSSSDASGASTRMFGINAGNTTFIGPIDSYAGGVILYGVAAEVNAQVFFTGATERLRITAAGLVGIGTSSPRSLLNPRGSGATGAVLTLENSNTALTTGNIVGQINFFANDASSNGTGAKVVLAANVEDAPGTRIGLTFATSDNTSATGVERLRITSAGNVGIGTDITVNPTSGFGFNPSSTTTSTLYATGQNGAAQLILSNNNNGTNASSGTLVGRVSFQTRFNGAFLGSNVVASLEGIYTGSGTTRLGDLTFSTSGGSVATERMRITSAGNVGIGTSSPGAKLDVTGAVASSGLIANIKNSTDTGGDNTRFAGINFQIGTDDSTASIRAFRTNSANDFQNALTFWTKGTGAPGTNPIERLRITSAGNVGIGVTAPGDKLEIGGAGAGIILASPNGTRYRITVDNAGVLTSTAV